MLSEIEQFVNWVRRRNPQARTWKDYGYDLGQFAELIGDLPPSGVTFHDIDRFVAAQAQRGFKSSTINRRLAAIIALVHLSLRRRSGAGLPSAAPPPSPA